jgi:hypothetical protein
LKKNLGNTNKLRIIPDKVVESGFNHDAGKNNQKRHNYPPLFYFYDGYSASARYSSNQL